MKKLYQSIKLLLMMLLILQIINACNIGNKLIKVGPDNKNDIGREKNHILKSSQNAYLNSDSQLNEFRRNNASDSHLFITHKLISDITINHPIDSNLNRREQNTCKKLPVAYHFIIKNIQSSGLYPLVKVTKVYSKHKSVQESDDDLMTWLIFASLVDGTLGLVLTALFDVNVILALILCLIVAVIVLLIWDNV
jgi:hypothetical protein